MISVLVTSKGREVMVNDCSGKEIDSRKEILLLHPVVHYFYKDGTKGFATQTIDGDSYNHSSHQEKDFK